MEISSEVSMLGLGSWKTWFRIREVFRYFTVK
jgi:hypothetical protein